LSDFNGVGVWKRIMNGSIEYVETEFGSMYLDHIHSSQWSGFSLTPALWDLNALNKVTDLEYEDDETDFASKVLDVGLLTVHFPAVSYKFLG